MKKIILKAKDNYKLNLHIFETASKSTKGYIQVIHGMEEHQERYKNFAEILNKVSAKLDTETMIALNAKVDIDKEEYDDVAKEFYDSIRE